MMVYFELGEEMMYSTCHDQALGIASTGQKKKSESPTGILTSFPRFSLLLRERTQVTAGLVAPKIWEPKIRDGVFTHGSY